MSGEPRWQIPAHVYAREFAGEIIILDMAGGQYFSLDDVGARVWQGIVRGEEPGAIVDAIVAEYAADHDRVHADVLALTEELVRKGLVERKGGFDP